jgi:hypothetical protein
MQSTKHQAPGVRQYVSGNMRFFLGLLMTLILCFVMQALCYYGLDCKTRKGESNYFSTRIRFQAAAREPAVIAFAGSSITGRLPGREAGNKDFSNLGSDGGPALDGINMLVNGKIPLPEWLVIETNTLFGGVGYSDSIISRNSDNLWFKVGVRYPLLGAAARPSSMLYNRLLYRTPRPSSNLFPLELSADEYYLDETRYASLDGLTMDERKRLEDYRKALFHLRQKGVKLVLVKYPAAHMSERESNVEKTIVSIISNEFNISYLNLVQQIPRNRLQFTDGVHLAPESAAEVMISVVDCIKKQNLNDRKHDQQ